jgi:FkbH-like protein
MLDKNKVRISASSYIMPSSPTWDVLKKKFEIDFGEYGDWPNALYSENSNTLVLIIFLQDLIQENIDDLKTNPSNHFFSALITRLESTNSKTILAFSTWRKSNIIFDSRNDSVYKNIENDFVNTISSLRKKYQLFHSIFLDDIFGEVGYKISFDFRNYYAAHCRLSQLGIKQIVNNINRLINRFYNAPSKVLVLDCDNTIWGGVVGEVGIKGINLGNDGIGKAFQDFQRVAKQLCSEGVLIALASKNNPEDVWEVFNNHGEMILKKEDIIASKINWNEKCDNLLEISSEISLGLESFVFWDDNPLEREKMKNRYPEVLTIDVPSDVSEWPSLLRTLDEFSKFSLSKDDLNKTDQYKLRNTFVSEMNKSSDQNLFLKSINLRPQKIELDNDNISRAEQLCLKTNQFNFTTKRYSISEIEEMHKNDKKYKIFLVKLIDDFGDHGIIGLAILKKEEEFAILENLLLSCRVLGRKLEFWVFNEILKVSANLNCTKLITKFISSKKNDVALDFLKQLDLPLFENNDNYRLMINNTDEYPNELKLYLCDINSYNVQNLNIFL